MGFMRLVVQPVKTGGVGQLNIKKRIRIFRAAYFAATSANTTDKPKRGELDPGAVSTALESKEGVGIPRRTLRLRRASFDQ